jgi:hypothetical protein
MTYWGYEAGFSRPTEVRRVTVGSLSPKVTSSFFLKEKLLQLRRTDLARRLRNVLFTIA